MQNQIVDRETWLEARKALLEEEKAFSKARDSLTQKRQALPWVQINEDYIFMGRSGEVSLVDLFQGRSQLIVSQFMFHPDWDDGCKSCSFWADGYDPMVTHLNARDISLAVVSRAPIETLEAYRKRMGWRFQWVSSENSSFSYDFGTSFTPEDVKGGGGIYNYCDGAGRMEDLPGFSVFYQDDSGGIFHTYSCYARGTDMLNAAYQLMDIAPKGRDEAELPYTMAWLERHDEYKM